MGLEGLEERNWEHQHREWFARYLENKREEWNEESNGKYMWEQVQQAMVVSAYEACGSVGVGRKNPKSVYWNDVVKAADERGGVGS